MAEKDASGLYFFDRYKIVFDLPAALNMAKACVFVDHR
jgi:hypothetical protein